MNEKQQNIILYFYGIGVISFSSTNEWFSENLVIMDVVVCGWLMTRLSYIPCDNWSYWLELQSVITQDATKEQ